VIYIPVSSVSEKGLAISKLHMSKTERLKLFTFASIFGTSEKRCFTNESYYDIQQHATKPYVFRQCKLTELLHSYWNLLNNFTESDAFCWFFLIILLQITRYQLLPCYTSASQPEMLVMLCKISWIH